MLIASRYHICSYCLDPVTLLLLEKAGDEVILDQPLATGDLRPNPADCHNPIANSIFLCNFTPW
jgi:hypothetical protein